MANQEQAFIAAMAIATRKRPDLFSIKDGDFYFLDWRLPAWLVLALSNDLRVVENYIDEVNNIERMCAAELEVAA